MAVVRATISVNVNSPTSAARGSLVTIEYTFSNQGTSGQTFNNGFYLSTNNIISTGDTLLGSNTGASAGAGVTATFSDLRITGGFAEITISGIASSAQRLTA